MRNASAALPALLLVVVCGATPALRPTPTWAIGGLTAGGLALGGAGGIAVLAVGAGLAMGEVRRTEEPRGRRGLIAEIEGTVCGPWRARAEFKSAAARLCPDWLRIGGRVLVRPPVLFVDLPTSAERPEFGAKIVARGPLARFPGHANALATEPGPWRLRVKSQVFWRETRHPGWLARMSSAVRARVQKAVAATGAAGRPGVAWARALIVGDEGGLDEGLRRALRRVGLAHLVVVSGFNLTVVAVFAGIVGGLGPRSGKIVLPGVGIFLYLALVGPEPSMLRASIVGLLGLAILTLRRSGSPLHALSFAAVALVLRQPDIVDDLGFRLSFGATAGLIVGARGGIEPFTGWPRPVAGVVVAALAAQLGALPFAVGAFAELSPIAPLANLVAVPWAAAWLLVDMAWLVVALASPLSAAALAPVLDLGAAPFAWLERLPPSPWISAEIRGGLFAGILLATGAWAALCRRRHRKVVPLLVLAFSLTGDRALEPRHREVTFLDVGQGDATLLRDERVAALIDGGGLIGRDLGATVLRPALFARGVRALDVALLSHSDRDHCQGLLDLAALVEIRQLWSSAGQLRSGCGALLSSRISGRSQAVAAGDRLDLGDFRFVFLHPEAGSSWRGANAESLAFVLEVGDRRFLFGGDLGAGEERLIAARHGDRLAAGVLKVSHHGASGSTAGEWLSLARPRWAVVMVGGQNAYGHPAAATLARLERSAVRVLRTDRDGQVTFSRRDGGAWRLSLPGSPRRIAPGG